LSTTRAFEKPVRSDGPNGQNSSYEFF